MKYTHHLIIFLSIIFAHHVLHGDQELDFDLSGFVKADNFWDTRQVIEERERHTLFVPKPRRPDSCTGADINKHGQFAMQAIETSAVLAITGPKVCGADVKTYVSAEFYGPTDPTIETAFLIHAYAKFDWPDTQLIFGQFWHPMFIELCEPRTIAYSNGAPIEVQTRNPQIRYTKKFGTCEFQVTASSQTNYTSPGPVGLNSKYIRDGILPDMTILVQKQHNFYVFGAGIEFKRLVPRLANDFGCRVNESVLSEIAFAYACYNDERTTIATKIIYGGNGDDLGFISGYAVATQTPQDYRTYTQTNSINWWLDVQHVKGAWVPGFFLGITKNLGANRSLFINPATGIPIIFSSFPDSNYVFRFSPRIVWNLQPVRFALELEWTAGTFGPITDTGTVIPNPPVSNLRTLFTAYYFF